MLMTTIPLHTKPKSNNGDGAAPTYHSEEQSTEMIVPPLRSPPRRLCPGDLHQTSEEYADNQEPNDISLPERDGPNQRIERSTEHSDIEMAEDEPFGESTDPDVEMEDQREANLQE